MSISRELASWVNITRLCNNGLDYNTRKAEAMDILSRKILDYNSLHVLCWQ